MTVAELGWRLGLSVSRRNWHGDVSRRCSQTYVGQWEEFKTIMIRIRDKI
jgi:hypothetical protein